MVSVELKQEKTQCPRQFPDDCHSGIVPALYGQFIWLHSTKAFWENYSIEELLE